MLPHHPARPVWQQNDPPGGGPPAPPPAPPADPPSGMFTRDYVVELRQEAAAHRVRANNATAALVQVGELLGLDATAVADPQRFKHTLGSLRLAADVEAGIVRHGLDRKLTLALLAQEHSLADVQPGQPDTGSRLDEILTALAKATPAVKAGPSALPPRSGLPRGGGGTPPPISRAELANLPPERVAQLKQAGLLNHLLRGE